jgi:hypothetical protein
MKKEAKNPPKDTAKDKTKDPAKAGGAKDNLSGIVIAVKFIIFITGFCVLLISQFAFLFFTLAMLPSFTAILIDRRLNKCASSTLCAFNLIGIAPYIFSLWHSPDINGMAESFLIDVYVWLIIYGSASMGCITIWAIPQLTAKIFQAKSDSRILRIEEEQSELREIWGEIIVSRATSNH